MPKRVEGLAIALWGAAVWAGAAPALGGSDVAPPELRQALIDAYPAVTQWDITPLRGARSRPNGAPVQRILRIGQRSAVRLSDGTTAWYAVRAQVLGWTARHELPPRWPTDARDWSLAPVDGLDPLCVPLPEFPIGSLWRTRGKLTRGSPLCRSSIEAMPAIRRGDSVTLRSQVQGVSVSSRGLALSDGALGSAIVVRTHGSGRLVRGRVTQSSEVQVDVLH